MILIVTHKQDFTADFIIDKLNSQNISYYRLNCEDCLTMNLSFKTDLNSVAVSIAGHQTFNSIWYRRTKFPSLTPESHDEHLYLVNEADMFMRNIFGLIKGRWLSDPFSLERAENKFLQLEIARRIGLSVPETLVTSDRNAVKDFLLQHDKAIIKPISTGRMSYSDQYSKQIFSNIVPKSIIESFETFDYTPAIFQKYIEKEYEIRITVIGSDVFAAKVNSQEEIETSTDWRRKKLPFIPYDLPNEIAQLCILMLNELNVGFGAFDFIKSKDGKYYFLEVNPNGQWVWIEKDTGLKISDSIIKYLT